MSGAGDQFGRLSELGGIEQEVPPRHRRLFEPVGDAPIDEETALVLERGFEAAVAHPEVIHRGAALAKLPFPARHVGENEHVGGRREDGGTGADDKDQAGGDGGELGGDFGASGGIEEVGQIKRLVEVTEHRIIAAEKRGDEGVDLRRRFEGVLGVEGERGPQDPCQLGAHVVIMDARVTFDGDDRAGAIGDSLF